MAAESLCSDCQSKVARWGSIFSDSRVFHHPRCVCQWLLSLEDNYDEYLQTLLDDHLLRQGDQEIRREVLPLYFETLNITEVQIATFLDHRWGAFLVDFRGNGLNASSIIELLKYRRDGQCLLDPDTFWTDYSIMLPSEQYEVVMVEGYLPNPDTIADYRSRIDNMMTGITTFDKDEWVSWGQMVSAYHSALRKRKERHWKAFDVAVWLGKWIQLYHQKRYAPGSQEMRIAQTRFETGNYQV